MVKILVVGVNLKTKGVSYPLNFINMNQINLTIFDKKYLPLLKSWYINANNRKYMLTQAITEEDALRMIRNEEDRKCFSIMLGDLPIGYIVLMNIKSKVGRVVMMIDEPYTNKGYGFKSLSLLECEAKLLGIEKLT